MRRICLFFAVCPPGKDIFEEFSPKAARDFYNHASANFLSWSDEEFMQKMDELREILSEN